MAIFLRHKGRVAMHFHPGRPQLNLVPRVRDPFGLRQGSRSTNRKPEFGFRFWIIPEVKTRGLC